MRLTTGKDGGKGRVLQANGAPSHFWQNAPFVNPYDFLRLLFLHSWLQVRGHSPPPRK